MLTPALEVLRPGAGLTLQDAGRPGFAKFGLPRSGALDPTLQALANSAFANLPTDPVIEIAFGGTSLLAKTDLWLSLAGFAGSSTLSPQTAKLFKKGTVLDLHPPPRGVWSYLATPGGFSGPSHFDSVSGHARAGLGCIAKQGTVFLADPPTPDPFPGVALRHLPRLPEPKTHLRVFPAPHQVPTSVQRDFFSHPWQTSSEMDRTGYRLKGSPLNWPLEIPSLPVLPGTIQVPPNGQPIVTLNDGPTTGGYPVLGLLHPEDLPHLVQSAPGTEVQFSLLPLPHDS